MAGTRLSGHGGSKPEFLCPTPPRCREFAVLTRTHNWDPSKTRCVQKSLQPSVPPKLRQPPPNTSPGLRQAGTCTQSQSAPRQLSLPLGLTRAAMPRLSRFSRAGEGGWGAPGQAHGKGCSWRLRGHTKGRGDRPRAASGPLSRAHHPGWHQAASHRAHSGRQRKAGMHSLSVPIPDSHRGSPIQQPECRQWTG